MISSRVRFEVYLGSMLETDSLGAVIVWSINDDGSFVVKASDGKFYEVQEVNIKCEQLKEVTP